MPKDASGPKLPPSLPPPPTINPFAPANLKKRKKDKEVPEEGDLTPHNKEVPPKLQKMAKGKERAFSIKSKEDWLVAEVRLQTLPSRSSKEGTHTTLPKSWSSPSCRRRKWLH